MTQTPPTAPDPCLRGSLLPFKVFRTHFSPFRLILHREARLALVLNPKVGSTFLRDLMVDAGARFLDHEDPSQGRLRGLSMARKMPVAPVADYLDFLRDPGGYRIWSIVRNPYARLLSAWRDKFLDGHLAQGGADAGYPPSMRRGELARARKFAARAGLLGAGTGELVPFETFLAMVAAEPPGRRNHHWEDQWRIILYRDLPYTGIMRMEDGLGAPLADLLAPLGIDRDWVMQRAARPANPSSGGQGRTLTQPQADQIHDLFAADFDCFGYGPDSWEPAR